jgi:hypothetical protein
MDFILRSDLMRNWGWLLHFERSTRFVSIRRQKLALPAWAGILNRSLAEIKKSALTPPFLPAGLAKCRS